MCWSVVKCVVAHELFGYIFVDCAAVASQEGKSSHPNYILPRSTFHTSSHETRTIKFNYGFYIISQLECGYDRQSSATVLDHSVVLLQRTHKVDEVMTTRRQLFHGRFIRDNVQALIQLEKKHHVNQHFLAILITSLMCEYAICFIKKLNLFLNKKNILAISASTY